MNHVYDDNGNFSVDLLLVDCKMFYGLLNDEIETTSNWKERGSELQFIADALVYNYQIKKDFGGMGGCISVDEWFDKPENTLMDTAIKKMLKSIVDLDIVPHELCLVVKNFYHNAVIERQLDRS
jgi:hypothetical protein